MEMIIGAFNGSISSMAALALNVFMLIVPISMGIWIVGLLCWYGLKVFKETFYNY